MPTDTINYEALDCLLDDLKLGKRRLPGTELSFATHLEVATAIAEDCEAVRGRSPDDVAAESCLTILGALGAFGASGTIDFGTSQPLEI